MSNFQVAMLPDAGRSANARIQPATLFRVVIMANRDNPESTIELKDVKPTIE